LQPTAQRAMTNNSVQFSSVPHVCIVWLAGSLFKFSQLSGSSCQRAKLPKTDGVSTHKNTTFV